MRSRIRSIFPVKTTFHCLVVSAAVAALVGCSTAKTDRGEVKGHDASVGEWLQSDMNRVANVGMKEKKKEKKRMGV